MAGYTLIPALINGSTQRTIPYLDKQNILLCFSLYKNLLQRVVFLKKMYMANFENAMCKGIIIAPFGAMVVYNVYILYNMTEL